MTSPVGNWWGFRIRLPLDYRPEPVGRLEAASFFMLISIVLELLWLGRLSLGAVGQEPGEPWFSFSGGLLIPLLLTVVPVIAGLLLPPSVIDWMRIGPWLVLARERGELRGWDLRILVLAVVTAVALLFRLGKPHWQVTLILLADVVLACLGLALFQERVDFSKRRWKIDLPEWLRNGSAGDGLEEDAVVGPDEGAKPLYPLVLREGSSYQVGVAIQSGVLEKLRGINAAHNGILYQEAPLAVVLLDRDPVNFIGQDDVMRLGRQFLSIARKHALTRYQFADLVLSFVQKAINYQLDELSTRGFAGGPYTEYGRFALETVNDTVGDCECTAILCATLLAYTGIETALIYITVVDPETGIETGHAAVGVSAEAVVAPDGGPTEGFDCVEVPDGSGRRYLYGETAIDGSTMAFGGIPPEWKASMKVREVVAIPSPRGPSAAA